MPFEDIFSEFDAIFNPFFPRQASAKTSANLLTADPAVRYYQEPEGAIIEIDTPGVAAGALDVSVQDNTVKVSWSRTTRNGSQETGSRSFQLKSGSDSDAIKAEVKDGILTLSIPKKVKEARKILVAG